MNKDTVIIVTGGKVECQVLDYVLNLYPDSYIMGVDHGLDALDACGIMPDVAIGDFDSASSETKNRYINLENTVLLNPMKDFTDTHVAVERACAMQPKQIILVGATGTRLDHVQGNFALLKLCRMQGIDAIIYDATNKIQMIDQTLTLYKDKQYGKYVSIIPYSDEVVDITLTGFVYNLESATLIKEETIGISNEMREEVCHITVGKGYLMVMETKD